MGGMSWWNSWGAFTEVYTEGVNFAIRCLDLSLSSLISFLILLIILSFNVDTLNVDFRVQMMLNYRYICLDTWVQRIFQGND